MTWRWLLAVAAIVVYLVAFGLVIKYAPLGVMMGATYALAMIGLWQLIKCLQRWWPRG
jgi:hypothetical protein